jgi:hypothetical protein
MNEKNTGFELKQNELNMIGKASEYLKTIADFQDWYNTTTTANVENIDRSKRMLLHVFEDLKKVMNI